MSISILNRGGTSGGLKPELIVISEPKSIVELYQAGVLVDVYTFGEGETEHIFTVGTGAYTITGKFGADTKSVDVSIDTVGRYTVKLEYKLWLYLDGDECEDVTGGWVTQALGLQTAYNVPQAPILTKNATNMVLSRTSPTAYACGIILPKNKIDFTKYKTINITVDFAGIASNDNCLFYGYFIKDKLGSVCDDGTRWFGLGNNVPAEANKTMTGDISSCDGLFVPYISIYSRGSLTIRRVWLE